MELRNCLRENFLFHGLAEAQIDEIACLAEIRATEIGDVLWERLSQDYKLIVIIDGEVEVAGMAGQLIGQHGRGAILGESCLIASEPLPVSAKVTRAGRVALIPIYDLTSLLIENVEMRAKFMQNLSTLLCERLRQAGISLFDAGEVAVKQEA